VDIDAADVTNELAVVEYVDDMYEFYKLTEVKISSVSLSISIYLTVSIYLHTH
jgi:hypothetical protein